MKANELMIGDWVYSSFSKEPCRIVGIEEYPSEYCMVKVDKVYGAKDIVSLTHIPLTSEILERNGFKIVHGFGYSDKYPTWGWGYHNGIHDYCSIDVTFYDTPINGVSHLVKINRNSASGDGINTVHNCDIDYVHQLQHAIRLCGIEKEIEL